MLPSQGLREEIARTEHVFTPSELLKLAQRYAPDQEARLALLTALAEGVPTLTAHADGTDVTAGTGASPALAADVQAVIGDSP